MAVIADSPRRSPALATFHSSAAFTANIHYELKRRENCHRAMATGERVGQEKEENDGESNIFSIFPPHRGVD